MEYEWLTSTLARLDSKLIKECSELYSKHYGKWSINAPINANEDVKLSPRRLLTWLDSDNSAIYFARDNGVIVGYAIALRLKVQNYGIISWVTQLVVHEKYRKQDIAKNLLYSIWGFSNDFAWGIISANPYAVRALEKATRRRSDPVRIKHNIRKLLSIGIANVPYISKDIEHFISTETSKINTKFYVDHSNIDLMIKNVVSDEVPWRFGELEEGWEWLAFTFRDQTPIEFNKIEIKKIIEASDKVAQAAYKRMDLTENHKWLINTDYEVAFILKECCLQKNDTVIDFGCGIGRHSLGLASHGINAIGVDYIDKNIDYANKAKVQSNLANVSFHVGDCRTIALKKAKAVICLYDVIGTYTNNEENLKILENIYEHLDVSGIALLSVMNLELTEFIAKHRFSLESDPNRIQNLKPSNIMETTGNVFDPDYYLFEEDEKIVYRREQFERGNALPVELIVRDKRFTKNEIIKMCEIVGFEVIYSRYVNARNWEKELTSTNNSAKEILVKCRKNI